LTTQFCLTGKQEIYKQYFQLQVIDSPDKSGLSAIPGLKRIGCLWQSYSRDCGGAWLFGDSVIVDQLDQQPV
jgi:hypothetical protein